MSGEQLRQLTVSPLSPLLPSSLFPLHSSSLFPEEAPLLPISVKLAV
ncbi:hypothetical protein CKA32_002473 [Geitlerinema sp. FC II]|nr:hypothetical protein CKA32_002473 [Geitlerinema sp. FC II]